MSIGTADGPPAWTADVSDDDIEALTTFWVEAASHGWSLTAGRYTQAWHVGDVNRMVGAGYAPPNEVGNGCVDAHDVGRTLTRTGVRSHAEAVAVIREFHGWPTDGRHQSAATSALPAGGQP